MSTYISRSPPNLFVEHIAQSGLKWSIACALTRTAEDMEKTWNTLDRRPVLCLSEMSAINRKRGA
jgi:hypothetical protein